MEEIKLIASAIGIGVCLVIAMRLRKKITPNSRDRRDPWLIATMPAPEEEEEERTEDEE